MPKIEYGQYWLLANGSVIKIEAKSAFADYWSASGVSSRGVFDSRIYLIPKSFKGAKQLTAEEAEEEINQIFSWVKRWLGFEEKTK